MHQQTKKCNRLAKRKKRNSCSPMREIGFLANRSRPRRPRYLLRHPALHSRVMYSNPKKTTSTISWEEGRRAVARTQNDSSFMSYRLESIDLTEATQKVLCDACGKWVKSASKVLQMKPCLKIRASILLPLWYTDGHIMKFERRNVKTSHVRGYLKY